VRWLGAGDSNAELRIGEHDLGGDDSVGEDAASTVNVVDEGIDSADPLLQPGSQLSPFRGRKDPRQDVEGNDPLGGFLVAIDSEGDPKVPEGRFGRLLPARKFSGRRILEPG
jgi:hypothetical protein